MEKHSGSQRHMQGPTYRCFLPDLTGFVDLHCIGPEHSGIHNNQIFSGRAPQLGIQPCYSGLQVKGTAGSPPSTTKCVLRLTLCVLRSIDSPLNAQRCTYNADCSLNYNEFHEKILVAAAFPCIPDV